MEFTISCLANNIQKGSIYFLTFLYLIFYTCMQVNATFALHWLHLIKLFYYLTSIQMSHVYPTKITKPQNSQFVGGNIFLHISTF